MTPDLDMLPTSPGVYVFKDAAGAVLYVGKAANLRSRVKQYYAGTDERPTVRFLMNRVAGVDTTVTDTVSEALLLENTLIKRFQPRYNIQLRDDKDYVSLRINASHEWPMVYSIRRPGPEPGSLTFGPYSSAGAVRDTLRFLRRTFPLRTCRDSTLYARSRPCLEYQIGRCVAPCVGYVTKEDYRLLMDQVVLFLKGRNNELLSQLRTQMKAAAEAQDYEKAARLRDRIKAVERVLEEQKVDTHSDADRDVVGFHREGDRGAFATLQVRGGRLVESRTWLFDEIADDDHELLSNFVLQFYGTASRGAAGEAIEREVPPEILLPRETEDLDAIAEVLESARGGKVRVLTPQRGGKKDLVAMASANAESAFRRTHDAAAAARRDLESLARALDLGVPPQRIECVDNSMFQGGAPVGAIVAFVDGKPQKELYRRFHIKDLDALAAARQEMSDFAMMREVLTRRFKRALEPDAGNWAPPDLMVIDGGRGQLNIAIAVLEELGIVDMPLCALAKDPEHGKAKGPSEERVFVPGRVNPVPMDREKGGMFLLQRIRDEAHRFAITFHRATRKKGTLRSALDEIPGIGDTRRKALLRHFGSARAIAQASLEELRAVPTISATTAEKVFRFFQQRAGREEQP